MKYQASGISFNYSDNWQSKDTKTFNDPSLIAYFSEAGTGAFVQVSVQDLGSDTSPEGLQTYQKSWVDAVIVGQPISERSLNVAGVFAREAIFNDNNAKWRVVSLVKGNKIYDISFSVTPASFDKVSKEFDTLINSFNFESILVNNIPTMTSVGSTREFCPKCGAKLVTAAKFCRMCGTKI
jgi:hypothetical protein